MKPTLPTVGSIGTTRATGDGKHAAGADRPQHQSLKSRLLACLGMAPSAQSDRSDAGRVRPSDRFAQPGATAVTARGEAIDATPTAGAGAAADQRQRPIAQRLLRRSNRDTEMLAQSIRGQIASLPPSVAERFQRQLGAALRRDDPRERISMLTTLEQNVGNALRGKPIGPAGIRTPMGRTSPWHGAPSHPQTPRLVAVRFDGAVAQIPEFQEQRILSIRLGILKLPDPLAAGYRLLLRDVIATEDPAKRSRLLRQMSNQINEHLAR